MREGVPQEWFDAFLAVEGDVELILVYPPGCRPDDYSDPRLRQFVSPFRGEIIQRLSGLLNARGTYVLTINCDEYLIPSILTLAQQYFQRFPESWVLRLSTQQANYGDKAALSAPWQPWPDLAQVEVCSHREGNQKLYNQGRLLEIPIAPLSNGFDIAFLWRGRRDHHGSHTENFDKKIWKTERVHAALQEILQAMVLLGPVRYLPFWCLDRLLGLSLQAKFYESGLTIGHKMPLPEQLRSEDNPPEHKRRGRFYVFAEILLLRRFPQYGYLWTLVGHQIREIPVRALSSVGRKLKRDPSPQTPPLAAKSDG
ncbi:MAG: transposase [Leptolyngbya sp.]|nr:transposase [Leptolyngbya sp.]